MFQMLSATPTAHLNRKFAIILIFYPLMPPNLHLWSSENPVCSFPCWPPHGESSLSWNASVSRCRVQTLQRWRRNFRQRTRRLPSLSVNKEEASALGNRSSSTNCLLIDPKICSVHKGSRTSFLWLEKDLKVQKTSTKKRHLKSLFQNHWIRLNLLIWSEWLYCMTHQVSFC